MKVFPRAQIDITALHHNVLQLQKIAPHSKLMAVVKANAYGHGLTSICKHLTEVDGFGLARLEEAMQVRAAGVGAHLLLLEGVFRSSDLYYLASHNIDTVVHHQSQVDMLEEVTLAKPINVWIKIDTGMHRLGFLAEEFNDAYQRLLNNPNVAKPINFMTHFGCADDQANPVTLQQIQRFNELTQGLEGQRTLANSAGILGYQDAHQDWIRAGIALYGVSPIEGDRATNHGLQPAMRLISKLIAVRDHKAGEPVGYGGSWRSEQDTKLGVVAIGYGDGYPRNAPTGTPVYINGRRVPIVGRVSMDMLSVDLGADSIDKVGDDAILWGPELPVEEVAEYIGTISYELVTKLTPRVMVDCE
ncbi:alanine racemase [Paraferrimonas sp. SM1919]|uniref:alanine racemase n=1 Tax=Paraferrimonas sp. SM1919 TaxID=2662263 RepID=UPI0013D3F80A|nr:alanine racemase [Paraferrimonas sp. SM1919]